VDFVSREPEAVSRAQLQMLWEHARGGTLGATAFAILMAIYAMDKAPINAVATWICIKVAVAAARVWQGLRYRQADQPGDIGWWERTYRMLAVDGLVWGVGGFYIALFVPASASLVAACLVGVSCMATFGLQSKAIATACYVGPILVMTALGLFARLDEAGALEGMGVLVVLALQLRFARHSERRIAEVHHLRIEADRLASERRDALELAQRESAAKSQFLSSVSHELRTPLHGILGLARMLHAEAPTVTMKRRIELLEDSGGHLLRMVNDLIDVGLMHTDKLSLRSRRFDLVYELESLLGIYAVRAQEKSQTFGSYVQIAAPLWVMGDKARLRQILHNILSNAVKYTPTNGAITVVARHDSERLSVVCRDTGLGIAPERLEKIFEAFNYSRDHESSGLGLTIAREVARAMGGEVNVQSSMGVGSMFSFDVILPALGADGTTVTGAFTEGLAGTMPPRALVVEDDEACATVVADVLERAGLRVERVDNGADAIRHALRETDRPDIVLMDCRMPVVDGYAATREIRNQEMVLGLSRVPVIAVTAKESATLERDCREAGMDDLLRKPFVSSDVYSTLVRWLGSFPMSGESIDELGSPSASA
jgi:two-component system, sensor histidine kinase